MFAWSTGSGSLNGMSAGWILLQIEAVRDAGIDVFEVCIRGESGGRWNKRTAVVRLADSTGVLVDDRQRVMVTTVLMTSAELNPVHRVGHGELIVNVVLYEGRILGADIGLVPDVPAADVVVARLAEGKIKFKAANTQTECVLRKFSNTAEINELQIAVPEAPRSIITGDADVFIHPESDVAAEITCSENAEDSRAE